MTDGWIVRTEGNGTITVVMPDETFITGFDKTDDAHGWILQYMLAARRSKDKEETRVTNADKDRQLLGAAILDVKGEH